MIRAALDLVQQNGKLSAAGVGQIVGTAIVETADTYLPKPLPNIDALAIAALVTIALVAFIPNTKREGP